MADRIVLGMNDTSLEQICGEMLSFFTDDSFQLLFAGRGFVALPSTLKYSKGVLLDSSQGTYLARS